MKPIPADDEESDLGAISSVMAADMPEEEAAEGAGGDPEALVAELKTKLAQLEASLRGL